MIPNRSRHTHNLYNYAVCAWNIFSPISSTFTKTPHWEFTHTARKPCATCWGFEPRWVTFCVLWWRRWGYGIPCVRVSKSQTITEGLRIHTHTRKGSVASKKEELKDWLVRDCIYSWDMVIWIGILFWSPRSHPKASIFTHAYIHLRKLLRVRLICNWILRAYYIHLMDWDHRKFTNNVVGS